jgi:hypothetical protein
MLWVCSRQLGGITVSLPCFHCSFLGEFRENLFPHRLNARPEPRRYCARQTLARATRCCHFCLATREISCSTRRAEPAVSEDLNTNARAQQ